MKFAIVAGEASGDLLGADLICALKKQCPHSEFFGIAGPKMIAAGCNALFSIEKLSVVGIIEPIKHLPELIKIRRQLYQRIIKEKPDVFIGIDAPDFNLGLEVKLKKAGIKVVHYVSPSVWAWRQGRIHKIKRAVDLMLTLFPFETEIYEQHNIPVKFVGHPLADQIPLKPDQKKARIKLGLPLDKKILAILPGSRAMELKNMAKIFIKTAQICAEQIPGLQIITAMPNKARLIQMQRIETGSDTPVSDPSSKSCIKIFLQQSHEVIAASDVVLLAAGTVTLEAMLLKRPMVVAYRLSPISYHILKRLVKLQTFSLPNLIAGEKLVPEFLQNEVRPEILAPAILKLFKEAGRDLSLQKRFTELHKLLKKNASQEAAEAILV
ncbi:MAG: lipid-A-disaccharide synthase [Gammaproteobacteria bacterium]|nr:lipid-A-disaccharide synthase [Gammaproteobacteria bacterium]